MALYFVSCRTLAGQTVWAAHLYAATPAAARELGAATRKRDQAEAERLGYAAYVDTVATTWHARRSTAYRNALNAEA